jgi:hypothetical protein
MSSDHLNSKRFVSSPGTIGSDKLTRGEIPRETRINEREWRYWQVNILMKRAKIACDLEEFECTVTLETEVDTDSDPQTGTLPPIKGLKFFDTRKVLFPTKPAAAFCILLVNLR